MKIAALFALFISSFTSLFATPTSLVWTVCTTEVQAAKLFHIGVDNFFSTGNRTKNGSSFPPDIGLTYGLYKWNDISQEVGIDYLGGIDDPLFFNTKIGLGE